MERKSNAAIRAVIPGWRAILRHDGRGRRTRRIATAIVKNGRQGTVMTRANSPRSQNQSQLSVGVGVASLKPRQTRPVHASPHAITAIKIIPSAIVNRLRSGRIMSIAGSLLPGRLMPTPLIQVLLDVGLVGIVAGGGRRGGFGLGGLGQGFGQLVVEGLDRLAHGGLQKEDCITGVWAILEGSNRAGRGTKYSRPQGEAASRV